MSTPQPISYTLTPNLTADSLDTLPILSSLLARLQNPSSSSAASASPPAGVTSTSSQSQSQPQLAAGSGPLTIKDIPTATDGLKHKIQKARTQIKELQDMDRSIAEQQEEARGLELRIQRQREVLKHLRDVGLAMRREREQREGIIGGDAMVD